MPSFLVIALGNATKTSLRESAQGVFIKTVTAADADAAIQAFAVEQDQPGRFAAVPAGGLSSSVVERSSTLTVTPD
jgi:hypothetical protein